MSKKPFVTSALLALFPGLLPPVAAAPAPSIRNELLEVAFDRDTFSLVDLARGKAFATMTLEGLTGQVALHDVNDKTFGAGRALALSAPNGGSTVMVFPRLPFVVVRSRITNTGTDVVVLNKVPVVSAALDLATPVENLKGFGTGGISELAKNVGSYMWQAIVDPKSRNGVVGGWLTTARGSGVLFAGLAGDKSCLQARVEYGRLRLAPGKTEELETFVIGYFDDARLGMEAWAGAVAKVLEIRLPPLPTVYCTWYHAGSSDEQRLLTQADFAAAQLAPYGFSVVQIDDGWQDGRTSNGPLKNFTRVRPNGPYKSGMQATAERIKALGLVPGIWLMPFSGSHEDPWYADKQDFFARRADGSPHESPWGGTALDMTNPKALEYLRGEIHRIVKEWGYGYLKLDGLCSGAAVNHCYVNDSYKDDKLGDAVLFDPEKTNIEGYRDGLRVIRETAGRETFLLGCCAPQNMRSYGAPFGFVDAMRIGPDNGTDWSGIVTGPIYGARNYHLHGRIWYNDPDPLYVRTSLTLDQSRAICSWVTISGQLSASSDGYAELPPERIDILRRTMPSHGLRPRPVDLFEANAPAIWLLTVRGLAPRRDVVALYNWDQSKPSRIACSFRRIGLPDAGEFVAFDYWANRFVAPFREEVRAELPPASCRVLAVRPVADCPQLLSTSRHITQGIVDVLEEEWDRTTSTLRGVSRVVANDPYELRIIVPVAQNSWRAREITVTPAADLKCDFTQDGPKLRVAIVSPLSRELSWRVKFEPARIEAPAPAAVTGLAAAADYGSVTLSWHHNGADGYRVTRSDGVRFESAAGTFTDTTVAHGKTYRYEVQSLGWGDAASAPASVEVVTPAELTPPPTPQAPDIHLSDLAPLANGSGWGQPHMDKSVEGAPLTVGGKSYARGLGTHAQAVAVFAVPAGVRRFVAVVGLDDEKRDDPRASVTFEVHGDAKAPGEAPVVLAKSPVVSNKTVRSWAFDLELGSRWKELRLVVTDAGDGIAADHADWVDAGFVR